MTTLSPREIVSELDRHIIGQKDAKRAVAIALRNRWRRQQLDEGLREEVMPKNILMIGPTGVGKTEISRRLAKLANAPFVKVEATKFTEVGYVGRDVDQIVRDLVEAGIALVRTAKRKSVEAKAHLQAEERVLDALVGKNASPSTRDSFRTKLRAGELDDREIEIQVKAQPQMPGFEIPGMPGGSVGMMNLSDMLGKAMGGRTKRVRTTVKEAYKPLLDEAQEIASHKVDACVILQREQQTCDLIDEHDYDWVSEMATATPADCVTVAATDPLYILYTSGTTGQPKGVVRDNGGHMVALKWSMKNIYDVDPGEVYWAASDVGWVVGHSYICYAPLLHAKARSNVVPKPTQS